MRKLLSAVFLTFTFILVNAQQSGNNIFPKGFHLGMTGEVNWAQKMKVIPSETSPSTWTPQSKAALGGGGGLELSYHFNQYFGISANFSYAASRQLNLRYHSSDTPVGMLLGATRAYRFQLPVKFEFHHSLFNSNFFVYAAAGLNFNNVVENIIMDTRMARENKPNNHFDDRFLENDHDFFCEMKEPRERDGSVVNVDIQLNLGVYYRLPYNDLLRLSVAGNISPRYKLQGVYSYPSINTIECNGSLAYRHSHIGLELAYIHCFKSRK